MTLRAICCGRRNDQGAMMDDLTYFYDPARQHNSLTRRTCLPRWPMKPANYTYDASGNLSATPQGGLFTGSYTTLY